MSSDFYRRRVEPLDPHSRLQADLVWDVYRELDSTQWAPAGDVAEHQLQLARRIVSHAMTRVRWYREKYEAAGIDPLLSSWDEFRRLPVLKRQDCADHPDALAAESLPEGHTQAGEIHTSGTSGIPIRVRPTNLSQLFWLGLLLRDMEWSRVDPLGSLAAIRAQSPSETGQSRETWGRPVSDIVQTGRSHTMKISAPLERQWEWLQGIRPDYLLSYPTNLAALAALAEERGERLPGLKVIQSIAESLTTDDRERIERVFQAPVRDAYTCQEAGYLASQCPDSSAYHVHAESVLVEVVDSDGRPCDPGESGRVLVTTLRNSCTPFIRYEIGDWAVAGAPCSCGRGLPTLQRVEGKERPFFTLPDGRRKNTSTLPGPIASLTGVRQFQIEQQAVDRVVVRVLPGRQWSDAGQLKIMAQLHAFFEAPIQVGVELVEKMPRLPGGKMPCVVSRIG